jgi:outer membrane protein TolC
LPVGTFDETVWTSEVVEEVVMARFAVVLTTLLASIAIAIAQDQPAAPASPLSFEQAVNAAERAAESVAIARADVDRSEAGVVTARSGYLPTINGNAGYQRTLASEFDDINFGFGGGSGSGSGDGLGDLPFGQRNTWRLGVNVQQPLFDGFRTQASMRAARAGVRASRLGVVASRAQAVLQVAQAYYDAVLAQRQVDIAGVTLQQAEQTFNETELGFKQGATPEFDVVRAEVARDNQRTQLTQFEVQRDVALVQLRRLVGLPLDQPITLTTKLDGDDVEAIVASARAAAELPAGSARLAVVQAKEGVAAREATLDAAKADRLPALAASTDYGLVRYKDSPFSTDWRTNWTLGVTLTIPIFDGFRRSAKIATAHADLTSARAQLQQASEVSKVDTVQASANVAASARQLETTTRTVEQAQRAYQIAELRFQQGASTHLELVDSRVQLEQALLNQARSARDLRVARLRQELLPGLPLGSAAGF